MRPLTCGRTALGSILSLAVAMAASGAVAADLTTPALPDAWGGAPVPDPVPGFRWSGGATTREAAVRCLASAVYYEAGGEPLEGRQAVAQVVLNRVRHPAYPKSVCGVVYQGAPYQGVSGRGCQFTFACDGSLGRVPDARGWRDAEEVAGRALDGFIQAAVGASTHYHTLAVHPAWSATLTPTVLIGAHQFYRFPASGSTLSQAYAGTEPTDLGRGGRRAGRAAPPLAPGTPAAPQAATFSVWGLQVARVTPRAGGLNVAGPAT